MKPTPMSETARLSSNVLNFLGSDDVFRTAWIVKMFNMMAVWVDKLLKIQLTMYVDRKSFMSKMDGRCSNPSQIDSFMIAFRP